MAKIDLVGQRFTRLTVLERQYADHWWCRCDCGEVIAVPSYKLKTGHTKSCGCLRKKHGFWNTNYSEGTMKFYKMWQSMKARCDNPKNTRYKDYGGRGITYDPRWKDFLAFKEDLYFKYVYAKKQKRIKNPSFERIDVNKGYNKENCTFLEFLDQMRNRRSTLSFIAISPEGAVIKGKNANEFCREYGLNSTQVYRCLSGSRKTYKGWTFKKVENNQQKGEKDNG